MALTQKIIWRLPLTLIFLLIFQNGHARWRGNDLIELKTGFFYPPDGYYDAKSPMAEGLKEQYDTFLLNNLIFSLCYGRYLKKDLLVDFNAGLTGLKESNKTDDEIILKIIPLSLSINKILGVIRSAQYKIGAGFDYLLVRGKINDENYSNEIGGYHAKIGLRYFMFTSELKYSVIDRFGRNKRNLGGWTLNVGLAFQFFLF